MTATLRRGRCAAGLMTLSAVALAWSLAAHAQSWRPAALASFDDVWQTINDTFYDPAFGGVDWPAAKRDLRPRVVSASSMDEARDVIRELLARLKRSHFQLLGPSRETVVTGPAIVAMECRVLGDEVVVTRVTSPAASAAGLVPGQRLVSVDDRAMADVVKHAEGSDARSRALSIWRSVMRALHGPDGSTARILVKEPGGASRELRVPRAMPAGEVVVYGNLPPMASQFDARVLPAPGGKRVGYIAFSIWMPAVADAIASAVDRFRQYDGIVLDLRGNPGGLAAMTSGIAGHFLADPVELGSMRTRQAPAPLSFKANPRIVTSDGRRVDVFRGRVAILVDELTGSTSEVFAGAMQSLARARIFGRQTMGQALPAVTKQLPSGDVLLYAIGDFTTSNGRSLEGAGVVPDEPVPLTIEGLASGVDHDIDRAVKWLALSGNGR